LSALVPRKEELCSQYFMRDLAPIDPMWKPVKLVALLVAIAVKLLIVVTPWALKRRLLTLSGITAWIPGASIGWSWAFPQALVMGPRSVIGHPNIFRNIGRVTIGCDSLVGSMNWIAGYAAGEMLIPRNERRSGLTLGSEAAISNRDYFDCTDRIEIGNLATLAGLRSQFPAHSIDVEANVHRAGAISMGAYTFVGTSLVVLPGSVLPPYSVIGAQSLLNKTLTDSYARYGGVPSRLVHRLPDRSGYFTRKHGFVL
jgi:acetyltransferase-like isoleucine patch superfamily enzyme